MLRTSATSMASSVRFLLKDGCRFYVLPQVPFAILTRPAVIYVFSFRKCLPAISYTRYCELMLSLHTTRRIVSANMSATDSCLTLAQRFE